MRGIKNRAATALVAGLMLVGVSTSAEAGANSGWLYSNQCTFVYACNVYGTLGSNGAMADDAGCQGNVGVQIAYRWSSGQTIYQGPIWGTDWVATYHSGTFAYVMYH